MWRGDLENNKYILSLRSNTIDMAEIADIFNKGGGHKGAAACSFSTDQYNLIDIFHKLAKRNKFNVSSIL